MMLLCALMGLLVGISLNWASDYLPRFLVDIVPYGLPRRFASASTALSVETDRKSVV